MLIAIEGIDGSGKGTQARLLVERLNACGRSAALLSFPRYDATFFGRAVGEFLNGRFGSLAQAHPFLVSLLYAGDRFESRETLRELIARHDVLVLDRYVPSNVAHQAAKLEGADRERLIEWIETVEHGLYGLPRADLVILLDLDVAAARSLIGRKQARSYTGLAADLQEADSVYLARVRELYVQLAARSAEWRRVEGLRQDGTIRSVEDVAREIWTHWEHAASRTDPPPRDPD